MGFFSIFKKKNSDNEQNIEEQIELSDEVEQQAEEQTEEPTQEQATIQEPEEDEHAKAVKQDYADKPAVKLGFFKRLRKGLSKTSGKLVGGMESIFTGKKTIDEDLLEELEELFITSDIGVNTTMKIIDKVRDELSRKALKNPDELKASLKKQIFEILNIPNHLNTTEDKPYVIMVLGVNGAGKTTSIAKNGKDVQRTRALHLSGCR